MHENREISAVPAVVNRAGQGRPVVYNPDMHAAEKSDTVIVPMKVPNKIGKPIAEVLEGRPVTKGKIEKDVCDLYSGTGVSIERTGQNT